MEQLLDGFYSTRKKRGNKAEIRGHKKTIKDGAFFAFRPKKVEDVIDTRKRRRLRVKVASVEDSADNWLTENRDVVDYENSLTHLHR